MYYFVGVTAGKKRTMRDTLLSLDSRQRTERIGGTRIERERART